MLCVQWKTLLTCFMCFHSIFSLAQHIRTHSFNHIYLFSLDVNVKMTTTNFRHFRQVNLLYMSNTTCILTFQDRTMYMQRKNKKIFLFHFLIANSIFIKIIDRLKILKSILNSIRLSFTSVKSICHTVFLYFTSNTIPIHTMSELSVLDPHNIINFCEK